LRFPSPHSSPWYESIPTVRGEGGFGLFSESFMKCVFLFESVHRVMKAEKVLKEKGIAVDLIPVPREISSECGMAVELSKGSEEKALLILRENKISMTECYTKDSMGKLEKRKELQIKV
jgi:hypothetical protein